MTEPLSVPVEVDAVASATENGLTLTLHVIDPEMFRKEVLTLASRLKRCRADERAKVVCLLKEKFPEAATYLMEQWSLG